jgi:maltooligosyltrehalose trehalohydrolase
MTLFRAWAPKAAKVELVLKEARRAMSPGEGGWWSLNAPDVGHRADYGYALDGGEPLPDPRSPWQPKGVHGLSRVVDYGAFRWTDAGWQAPPLSSALVYELHTGTFTPEGTFNGVIDRLDHLVELGVTHVELMPVNEFSGERGWGYDGVDLFAPHHAYGGPEGLKRLVDACHKRGLAVILDVVYNHLGPSGNYLEQFGPYFTNRYSTPWGPAVNYDDKDAEEVRRFVCDNALMWLRDYHMDGLRIDAVHALLDRSAIHILEQMAEEMAALSAQVGRRLVLIAESDLNNPRVVQPRQAGGYGIDAQWSDDFHHALYTVLTGERSGYYMDYGRLADLVKALSKVFVYDGCYSQYRGRRHGRPVLGLTGHKFLGYIQNHDQIGNRARGDRSSHLMSVGRLKIAAALVLTAPFVPMLFQGEEWGASSPFLYFTAHEDEGLGRAVSEGRRREFASFGWKAEQVPDPQALETFQRSKLDWSEMNKAHHKELLEWHRRLVSLRRASPSLTDGRLDRVNVRFDEEDRWLVMERGPVAVACNFRRQGQRVKLAVGEWEVKLTSEDGVAVRGDVLQLPPESVGVLERVGRV